MFNILALGICTALMALSWFSYKHSRFDRAVLLLMGAAGVLRFILIGLDPFLHDWDERFHALVAKNLINDWLRPVLRDRPILPYDYRLWGSNHVWLHKQPLFLWQIALSMKTFGLNEIALRLPSALLGTLIIWPVYRIGTLIASEVTGYFMAILLAFAYYSLELTTGWQSVDHSDVAFLAFVTASLWAYYEKTNSKTSYNGWAVAIGVFAGAAVLCKWLPGLVVYAAWLIEVIANKEERGAEFKQMLIAMVVTVAIAFPWQLYTNLRFPLESKYESNYAAQHFIHVLEEHEEPWHFYFIHNMWYQYQWLVVLVAGGITTAFLVSKKRHYYMRPLLVSGGLIFIFFTLAATKMPSYTYVVAPCIYFFAALAWVETLQWICHTKLKFGGITEVILMAMVIVIDLRPTSLAKHHTDKFSTSAGKVERQSKIKWAEFYKNIDKTVPLDYVIFNVPEKAEIEAMFYSKHIVYPGFPSEEDICTLRDKHLRVAAVFVNGEIDLPSYLNRNELMILRVQLSGASVTKKNAESW